MSDISFNFGWEIIPIMALMLGWPGLVAGAALGALGWRRHRWLGGILGGLGGTVLLAGLRALAM